MGQVIWGRLLSDREIENVAGACVEPYNKDLDTPLEEVVRAHYCKDRPFVMSGFKTSVKHEFPKTGETIIHLTMTYSVRKADYADLLLDGSTGMPKGDE